MLATKITNHVQQALERLLQQYKGQPNLAAVITALVEQIQDLENAIFSLDEGRQLFNGTTYPSVGAQLDGIGELVGIQRNGLVDEEYLIFILGKIAENFSDTTIPTIVNIVGLLYNAPDIFLKECYPGGIAYEVGNPELPENLFNVAKFLVQSSLGAAIAIVYIATYDQDDVFTLGNIAGTVTKGQGFGSTTNPAEGGGFASLIYSNPNS